MDNFGELWEQLGSRNIFAVQEARGEMIQEIESIQDDLLAGIETGSIKQVANAVIVMGESGLPCFEEKLCDLLRHHENSVVRSNAAKMLGNYSSEQVLDCLTKVLNHDSEVVGMWILVSLGKIGGDKAKQVLLDYLHSSPSHTMIYMTLRALGDIGDEDLIPVITPYLTHEKNHVQTDAQLALEKIRNQPNRS